MKKTILVLMILAVAAAGCKQRQEQRPAAPYPAAPLITADDIRHLQDAAKMAPKSAAAWTALGNAYMDTKQFNEAIEAYQKALALDPKNVDVRVDVGTCYRGAGKPEKALEEYRKALAINPDHINARRNSGVVLLYDLNDRKQAAKEFEKYLQIAPHAADAGEIRQIVQELKAGK